MAIFYLKYRDTRPTIEVALLDPDESAHDLTGATSVTMHIRLQPGGQVTSKTMTIDADPTTGLVTYIWLAADWTTGTILLPGMHTMEYEVVGPATARLTFPNDGYDTLHIVTDQGQA